MRYYVLFMFLFAYQYPQHLYRRGYFNLNFKPTREHLKQDPNKTNKTTFLIHLQLARNYLVSQPRDNLASVPASTVIYDTFCV